MLYCRVTLGSVGTGKSGIRRPPEKRGGGLHDSVGQVHGGNGMYVGTNPLLPITCPYAQLAAGAHARLVPPRHVVFDNHQAFPEYTIHYR